MSILIKGMSMPKNCKDCPLLGTALNCRILEVAVDGDYYNPDARHEDCPLIELPQHGDLIDRSKLAWTPIDITDLPLGECLPVYLKEDVDSAPIVLESEKT